MNPQDPSNMHDMIANFPKQFAKGIQWASHVKINGPIKHIVITGMGGSALPGDLVNTVFQELFPEPITLNRSYELPSHHVGSETLLIACSFSGNTEETISAYNSAISYGHQIVVITAGGTLAELAPQNGHELVLMEKESPDFQPRMGSGYFFGAISTVLASAGWLPKERLDWITVEASQLSEFDTRTLGQDWATFLRSRIPVIYAPEHFWPVARIAKIKFNENAKIPAFWNFLPELNHNELVGFTQSNGNYAVLILQDPSDIPGMNHRAEATATILKDRLNIPVQLSKMQGKSLFAKVFVTLQALDWASYLMALDMGIDPTPVQLVEDFKQVLQQPQ